MSDETSLQTLLRERQTLKPPPRDAGDLAQRRQRMVRALRAHLVAARVRSQRTLVWRRIGLGVFAFGTAAMALFAFTRLSAPPANGLAQQVGRELGVEGAVGVGVGVIEGALVFRHGHEQRNLAAGHNVEVSWDDALTTPADEGAELRLSDLVNMTLSPETEVAQMTARGGQVERITLTRGRAHLRVAKLTDGRRFHVLTPFAEVQVRGTAFDVELLPGLAPSTCVRVQEGLVEVKAAGVSHLLPAGHTWGCDPAPLPGLTRAAATPPPAPPARTRAESRALAAQNRLFQQALRAQRAGAHQEAAKTYRAFLQRYPGAPLAAQARANLATIPQAR
ncbi:MAG TPA: FecR domain-containing protein [Polyangia bacterium]